MIEVMIAVAVASLMLMPVFTLQTAVLMRVTRQTRRLESIFFAEQFQQEVRQELPETTRQFSKEKTVENIKLIYTLAPVGGESKVKQFPGMLKEVIEARWRSGRDQIKEVLVSYIYKPEKEKEA